MMHVRFVALLVDILLALLWSDIVGKHIPTKRFHHRFHAVAAVAVIFKLLSMMMNSSAPRSELDIFMYALLIANHDIEHLLVQ